MEELLTLKEVLIEMAESRSQEYKARLSFRSNATPFGMPTNYTYEGILRECESKSSDPDHLFNLKVWDWCGSEIHIVIHKQQLHVINVALKEEMEGD